MPDPHNLPHSHAPTPDRWTAGWAAQIQEAVRDGMDWVTIAGAEQLDPRILQGLVSRLLTRPPGPSTPAEIPSAAAQGRIERACDMWVLYSTGATLDTVGERYHVSRERVRQIFAEYGLPTRNHRAAGALRSAEGLERARRMAPLVVGRRRAGASVPLIARELNVSRQAVKEVLAEHLSDQERHALRLAGQVREDRYSFADAMEAVQLVAELLGRAPTSQEYTELAAGDDTMPSSPTICTRWGWSATLAAAGVIPEPRLRVARVDRVTVPDCWRALHQVAVDGQAPTQAQYLRARESDPSLPSLATMQRRLGGWARAVSLWPGPEEERQQEDNAVEVYGGFVAAAIAMVSPAPLTVERYDELAARMGWPRYPSVHGRVGWQAALMFAHAHPQDPISQAA